MYANSYELWYGCKKTTVQIKNGWYRYCVHLDSQRKNTMDISPTNLALSWSAFMLLLMLNLSHMFESWQSMTPTCSATRWYKNVFFLVHAMVACYKNNIFHNNFGWIQCIMQSYVWGSDLSAVNSSSWCFVNTKAVFVAAAIVQLCPQRLPPTGPPLFRPCFWLLFFMYMLLLQSTAPREATKQFCTLLGLKQVLPAELTVVKTNVRRDVDSGMVFKLFIH